MSLSNIHTIQKLMEEHHLKFKKKYGQNFLIDQNILENICKSSSLDQTIGVIEIGPGLGSLTEVLSKYAKKVVSFEIDEELIPILNQSFENQNVKIIHQDILTVNLDEVIELNFKDCLKVYVVSNLPYYITTPILTFILSKTEKIDGFVLMMQKEVGEKLLNSNKNRSINALDHMISYKMSLKKLFNIPKTVFYPRPNVDSSVLLLTKKEKKIRAENEAIYYQLLENAFSQRRKTLLNNLLEHYPIDRNAWMKLFGELEITPDIRSEALSGDKFILISNFLNKR